MLRESTLLLLRAVRGESKLWYSAAAACYALETKYRIVERVHTYPCRNKYEIHMVCGQNGSVSNWVALPRDYITSTYYKLT